MSRLMSLCEFEEMQKYKMIIKREQKKNCCGQKGGRDYCDVENMLKKKICQLTIARGEEF